MARALSLDLRERVIAAIEAGASCGQAAERFGVAKASAIRWHARFRAEGEIAAKPMGGDRHSPGSKPMPLPSCRPTRRGRRSTCAR
jgi:transposase